MLFSSSQFHYAGDIVIIMIIG